MNTITQNKSEQGAQGSE